MTRTRPWWTAACLALVVVAFPVFKIHVLDQTVWFKGFARTGDRGDWYRLWIAYVGAAVVLAAACVLALTAERRLPEALGGRAGRRWDLALAGLLGLFAVAFAVPATHLLHFPGHPAG